MIPRRSTTFYKGLGRPQGLAFDADGNLYVAASLSGTRGIIRITPDAKASASKLPDKGLSVWRSPPGDPLILATRARFTIFHGIFKAYA